MNAEGLRKIANEALKKQQADKSVNIAKQIADLYEFLKPIAAAGKFEATYEKYLSDDVIEYLRSHDGLKILDLGENVACVYEISWYPPREENQ